MLLNLKQKSKSIYLINFKKQIFMNANNQLYCNKILSKVKLLTFYIAKKKTTEPVKDEKKK